MTDRLQRLVDRLRLRPTDDVLEIGCGHGVAASLICDQLTDGRYLATDRSAKMIAAAKKRNAEHVKSGRAEFVVGDFEDTDFGTRRFDKILAVRVRLFLDNKAARAQAKALLKPGGKLLIEYDEP